MPFTQSTHYFGIGVLALSLLGLFRLKGRRRWIWGAISGIVLLIGFGNYFPVLYGPMYYVLPYFNRFRVPSMIYSTLPLCLGYLAAGGLDWVLEAAARWTEVRTPHVSRADLKTKAGARKPGKVQGAPGTSPAARRLLLLLGILAVAWFLFAVATRAGFSAESSLLKASEIGRIDPAAASTLHSERMGILQGSLAEGFLVLLLGSGLLLLAAAGIWPRRAIVPWLGATLVLIVIGDLFLVGRRFYQVEPKLPPSETIPMRGACEFLSRQPGVFRIFPASGDVFSSNSFGLEHLESIGGYHPAKLRIYQDLLERNLITQPAVLRMLNVRYILSPAPLKFGLMPEYQGDGYVYALPDSLPRAWSVGKVSGVPDGEALLGRLGEEAFNPAEEALLLSSGPRPGRETYSPAAVTIASHAAGRLSVRTTSDSDAFLVVSEISYAPGWRAAIDGAPAKIYRVDHVLMGCEVPAGTHEVVWTVQSPGLRRGRSISLAASGLTLLLAIGGGLLLRRSPKTSLE